MASVAQAGIALAEGDYKGALAAAAGVIPGGKLIGGAVKATAKALDKIGDGAKVVDKLKDVASTAKRACGNCFTAGTEVSTPKGLVKIEDLRVGDKVTTTNIAKDKPDGWTEVDPKRWRVVKLLMPDPKGSEDVYEIELLRSLKWIREVGAAPRRWIEISLPEMGLTGPAKVAAIIACPKIKAGPGRVVLMTVTHIDQGVMEIEFAGLKKALEPTASHPLFSEDRNDWVAAGQLRVGERIRTKTSTARIEAIRWKKGEHRVYNIEVEADHAYFVSMLDLLSHNSNPCTIQGASKTPTEMATDLSKQTGKNRAIANTPNKQVRIDLNGKPHFDKGAALLERWRFLKKPRILPNLPIVERGLRGRYELQTISYYQEATLYGSLRCYSRPGSG